VRDLEDRGKIDLSEGYIDATFMIAKKRGLVLGRPSRAKAARSWQYQPLVSPGRYGVFRRKSPSIWASIRMLVRICDSKGYLK
jgi:hypothetical protein